MRCLDEDCTHLLIDNVDKLTSWLEMDGTTHPELLCWIPKYILMRNDKPFSQLGHMSPRMHSLTESQDKIGWRNFTKGYISTHFCEIQNFHLTMTSSYLNGTDWTKQFISKILQITHLQWIYSNILLHNKSQGYIRNKQSEDLPQEINKLSDLRPEDIPKSSRFLLEINFTELTLSYIKMQAYWTLAVLAALMAKQLEDKQGASLKQIRKRLNTKVPSRKKLGITAIEQQIRDDGMHQSSHTTNRTHEAQHKQTMLTSFITKHLHPSTALSMLNSNKWLYKLD